MAKILLGRPLKIFRPTIAKPVDSFNTAIGGSLSVIQKLALTDLFRAANELGVWDTAAIINMLLPDLELSKYNFLNSSKFKLAYPNGMSISSQGITADGTSQYYTTSLKPATDTATWLTDFAIDVFIENTGASGTNYMLGVSDGSAITLGLQQSAPVERVSNSNAFINTGTGTATQYFNLQSHALVTIQRVGNVVQIYQFGQKMAEVTAPATALPASPYELFGFTKNTNGSPFGFSAGTQKHVVVRRSMSEANVQKWTQALIKYHIATGRMTKSILVNGDSISKGMGVSSSYVFRLASALGLFPQNFGLSGERISTFMDTPTKAQAQIPVFNNDVHSFLIEAYGTNDMVQSMSATDYGNYLTAYINLALSRGWPASKICIIARFYQKSDAGATIRQQYNDVAQTICQNKGAKLIDVYTALKTATNTDTVNFPSNDGVHPNDVGQQAIATAILSQL